MDIINQLKLSLNALVDARGLDKSIIIVDMLQKLEELEKQFKQKDTTVREG